MILHLINVSIMPALPQAISGISKKFMHSFLIANYNLQAFVLTVIVANPPYMLILFNCEISTGAPHHELDLTLNLVDLKDLLKYGYK